MLVLDEVDHDCSNTSPESNEEEVALVVLDNTSVVSDSSDKSSDSPMNPLDSLSSTSDISNQLVGKLSTPNVSDVVKRLPSWSPFPLLLLENGINDEIRNQETTSTKGDYHMELPEVNLGLDRRETTVRAMHSLGRPPPSPPPPPLPPPPPPLPPGVEEKNGGIYERRRMEYKRRVGGRLVLLIIKVMEGYLGCHKNRFKRNYRLKFIGLGSRKLDHTGLSMKVEEKLIVNPKEPYSLKLVSWSTSKSFRTTSACHEKSATIETSSTSLAAYQFLVKGFQNPRFYPSGHQMKPDNSKFLQNSKQHQFKLEEGNKSNLFHFGQSSGVSNSAGNLPISPIPVSDGSTWWTGGLTTLYVSVISFGVPFFVLNGNNNKFCDELVVLVTTPGVKLNIQMGDCSLTVTALVLEKDNIDMIMRMEGLIYFGKVNYNEDKFGMRYVYQRFLLHPQGLCTSVVSHHNGYLVKRVYLWYNEMVSGPTKTLPFESGNDQTPPVGTQYLLGGVCVQEMVKEEQIWNNMLESMVLYVLPIVFPDLKIGY